MSLPCLASTETTVLTGTVPDEACCADQDGMPQPNAISCPRIAFKAVCLYFIGTPFARSWNPKFRGFASPQFVDCFGQEDSSMPINSMPALGLEHLTTRAASHCAPYLGFIVHFRVWRNTSSSKPGDWCCDSISSAYKTGMEICY